MQAESCAAWSSDDMDYMDSEQINDLLDLNSEMSTMNDPSAHLGYVEGHIAGGFRSTEQRPYSPGLDSLFLGFDIKSVGSQDVTGAINLDEQSFLHEQYDTGNQILPHHHPKPCLHPYDTQTCLILILMCRLGKR